MLLPEKPASLGSPLHTWGAPMVVSTMVPLLGIIPTYVGSTAHHHRQVAYSQDHPYIRGEHTKQTPP